MAQKVPLTVRPVLAEAWAMFRRDRDWLLRVAGPFLFLPQFALYLLVPRPPAASLSTGQARDAQALAWAEQLSRWFAAHGWWYLLAMAVSAFGMAALYSAYLDGRATDIRAALGRAGSLLPRYLLASVIVSLPAGVGIYLLVIPGLYVMGRTMMVGPALVAQRPLAAGAAISRSIALTSGSTLTLTALAGLTFAAGVLLATPFATPDGDGGAGRVAAIVSAAGLAAVFMAVSLVQMLIAVVVYRRLAARQGT